MKLAAIEDSLGRWLGSKWTMYAYRVIITLGIPLLAFMLWMNGASSASRTDLVEAKVNAVAETQDIRTTDAEAFQREVRGAVAELNGKIKAVDDKVYKVSVDVGVVMRLVRELRDQSVADIDWPSRLTGRPSTQSETVP